MKAIHYNSCLIYFIIYVFVYLCSLLLPSVFQTVGSF